MAEIKLMKMIVNGEQVYVQTKADGVVGLGDVIDAKMVEAGAGAVSSVNNKTGKVVLTAADVGALPSSTSIPTIPGVATTSANGLMASVDKVKLNGIDTGAQKNPSNATTSTAGLMSATDKVKLDKLPVITFEEVGETNG